MRALVTRAWRAALLAAAALVFASALHAQHSFIQTGDVQVHYWPGQQRLAERIAASAQQQRFPGLPANILHTGTAIALYIAPDAARFDSLTGGRAPDWGAGVAFPQYNIIVVPGYVSDRGSVHELRTVVRHELAHIALQRHLGTVRVPRWFTEGYATWTAAQFDENGAWTLRLAFMTGAAPALDSLSLDWPDLEGDARTAYLLSASAVRYLYSLGDAQAFARFLEHWRDDGSLEQSLRSVYLISSAQFERIWRRHVKRSYGWTQILAQSLFVWLIVTLMVLVLFAIRRRRDRRRMQRLRETELPDAPAYWLDPEEETAGTEAQTDDATGDQDGAAPPRA